MHDDRDDGANDSFRFTDADLVRHCCAVTALVGCTPARQGRGCPLVPQL